MKNNKEPHIQSGIQVPKPIIWTGRMLQFFSPEWAAKFSRFFFKRPFRHKPKRQELAWREKAEHFDLFVPGIKKKIRVYRWGKGDKKILLIHGWSGRGTQMYHLIDELLKNGYEVYSFDAPAHGLSESRSTLMLEFMESIKEVSREFGPFYALIGHSMGGIASINVLGRNWIKTDKLVTIGIPDSIKEIFYRFARMMGLKDEIAERNIAYMKRVYGVHVDELAGSYQAKNIHIPVLVIHDKKDREVPYTEAENLIKALPKGELYLTEGFGHTRILRNPMVIEKIINFLKENKDVDKR